MVLWYASVLRRPLRCSVFILLCADAPALLSAITGPRFVSASNRTPMGM